MTRLAPLAVATLVAAATGVARGDDPAAILLAVLDVESAPGLAVGGPLRATIELNASALPKVASLREWFPGARESGGRVAVVLEGRSPSATRRPTAAHRRASFLVDFDRPEVAPFREEVERHAGARAAEELATVVSAWVERKTMTRGIDVASRVATHREGDCTEHAVLLAAAARIAGRPARVVFGVALVPVEGRLRGFGHAWAEIHDGSGWRTVDATPLPAGVRYLPLGAIGDEGPGYLVGAWANLSPIDVRRLVLESALPARAEPPIAAPPSP